MASRTTGTSLPSSRPRGSGGARSVSGRAGGRGSVGRIDPDAPAGKLLGHLGARLGLERARDLLFHLPRRYLDLRTLHPLRNLASLEPGTLVATRARVLSLSVGQTWRRGVQVTTARLADETGEAEAVWYGRRYIDRRVRIGDLVVLSGRLKRAGLTPLLDNPEFQRDDGSALLHAGRIVPVYRLTKGLTAVRLRHAVGRALEAFGRTYPEYLPPSILGAEGLLDIGTALEEAHFPTSYEARDAAITRLAFDELLALQLGMVARRRQRGRATAGPIVVDEAVAERVVASVVAGLAERTGGAVELTPDQMRAIEAIRADLARSTPMLRLLQGDVGSGKTAVAAVALGLAALAGRQAVLLAPTDLLARQHAETLDGLLAGVGLEVALLTGSLPAGERRAIVAGLASGLLPVVVGTHALLEETVTFHRLGLVVIDEQHRFGVEQRGRLEARARDGSPHVLLMTATPIPRTLGQVVYADLDVSDLRIPPAGRRPVRTAIRHPEELDRVWAFVRSEAAAGRRTFVVVPLIGPTEPTEADEETDGEEGLFDPEDPEATRVWAAAAEAEAERLRALLAPLRVGLVHGRMPAIERDAVMADFRDGRLDVLVGTTVVEVGVDVPAASVMVVEGADRFGLAQLHQLRGRVGRGTAQSYCVLVSDAAPSRAAWDDLVAGRREPASTAQARLVELVRSNDGFALAERDFELRGEGDVLGLSQSGLPRLRVAALDRPEHRTIAGRTRRHAEALLDQGGQLRPGHERLAAELETGWLRHVHRAEPASGA
ncbi:MAG: ATP-dependent DNA helicase RecG [Chloroflexota bacterium]|nr:MAG: ATP-dependent DNA helicase RecG [Chloroflexota bacterium]